MTAAEMLVDCQRGEGAPQRVTRDLVDRLLVVLPERGVRRFAHLHLATGAVDVASAEVERLADLRACEQERCDDGAAPAAVHAR